MNSKVAEHLTKLFLRSKPIVMIGGDCWSHPTLSWDYISDLIVPIEKKNEAAAQDEEIRAAARERREASHYYCGVGHSGEHSVAWHPYGGFGRILLEICRGEIEAVIAADNAKRLAEYEAYRIACEQGVAIPPN